MERLGRSERSHRPTPGVVRVLRLLAWCWLATTVMVLVGAAVTISYGDALNDATTYGVLVDLIEAWQLRLGAWMWASWLAAVISAVSFVGLALSAFRIIGVDRRVRLLMRDRMFYVGAGWMLVAAAVMIHVVAAATAAHEVPSASLLFVSADTPVAPITRQATFAASNASRFPVRGVTGFVLLLAFVMLTAAVAWQVRQRFSPKGTA